MGTVSVSKIYSGVTTIDMGVSYIKKITYTKWNSKTPYQKYSG